MKALTRSQRNQGGLSTAGWLGVVAIFGLLVVSFFKVFPFYYDNFKLKSALEALAQDPEIDAFFAIEDEIVRIRDKSIF